MEYSGGSPSADHLCVLVHGLWGNPDHMANIAKCLRAQYSPDQLHLLFPKRNIGSFTYDGIERGGERVCSEIEEELAHIKEKGGRITKLSIIGYSLGGLVSRYAVGILYAKGILDNVECMNFATFATPHLGVRTPLKGWHNNVWNILGARTLSMSGRQLFIVDKFRDTSRPLLAVLADPNSIFMSGLQKFKRHTLYTNIVNDRSAVFYTTGISKTDPYKKLDTLKVNYLEGYGDVLLDPKDPFDPVLKHRDPVTLSSVTDTAFRWLKWSPRLLAILIFIPIGTIAFLINSVVQTVRSSSRIRRHENGQAGLRVEDYRMPLWIKEMREEVEYAYGALNNAQDQEYLGPEDEDEDEDESMDQEDRKLLKRERSMSLPSQPTLALAPCQFEMIRQLDTLGWRKYPVWIHKNRHSHAAMIVRLPKKTLEEGFIVLKHFINEEFIP